MSLSADLILNTIRNESSKMYQDRIPQVNADNLGQVGKMLLSSENEQYLNHFIDTLINRIAFTQVIGRMYENPLKKLKKNGVPFGSTIQEIFVNPSKDMPIEKAENGKYLLKTTTPDTKVAYYGLSRMSRYPITINESDLELAFTNNTEFMSFYTRIMQSMYNGDEIDEYLLSVNLMGKVIDEGAMHIIETDISNPKEVSKAMSNMSKDFQFPKGLYNGYNLVNADKISAGETECITHCPKKNQVLILQATAETEITYEFLANAFNLDLVTLQNMTILVDNIPSEKYDVYGILMDEQAYQLRDKLYKVKKQEIGSELQWNFWLHHWQIQYISMFGNCVAFAKTKEKQ